MTASSLACKMAAASLLVLLSANLGVFAQTPTQTWTPASTCTNGLPNPASSNGTYTDAFGANWAVQCAQDSTGFSYDQFEGTNGHGVYACFLGCDNRPGCTAFMYQGTVAGANTGSGKCYYKYSSGTYYSNSSVYASGNLISNGTPNKPCPYYNQTTYTDTNGNIYQVYCGFDLGGGSVIAGTYRSDGMASCMTICDSTAGCTSFTYTYTGAEPLEGATNTDGTCNLRSGSATVNSAPNPSVGAAVRVGTTSVSQASTATSSSTPAASACNLAPSPSAPSCPSASGLMFTDPCGTNYTVYCGNDTSPGAVTQGTANSISACMQLCDNYSGCVAATLAGTTCYLKTSFTAVTTTTNSALVALVRYVPPNPNYAVPPLAPCQNCSAGCGSTLPSGITINAASSVLINFNNPSDGLLRNYTIHIPQYYDINHAAPLILAFHGNGDNAASIESQTGMSKASLNPYGIAVYVNGYGKGFESNPSWAPGGTYSYVDDIGFIKNLIANLTQTYCIDTGRIFAVGHSNGGGFTGVMACDPVLSVKVAAFAANSGAFYTNFTTGDPATIEPVNTPVQPLCSPGRANVPFIEFHGTADTQIRYYGDTTHNGRILPSLPHWSTDWSVRDGYGTSNYSTTPYNNVVKYQFGGNGAGQLGIITHYMLIGWVHAWAAVSGGAPMDASQPIMDFLYRWSDPNRAPLNASSFSSSSSSTQSISTSSSSTSSSSSSAPFTTTTTSTSTTTTTTSTTTSTSSLSSLTSSSSSSTSSSSSSSASSTLSSHSSSSSISSSSSSSSVSSTVSSTSPTSSNQSSSTSSSSVSSSRTSVSSTSTQGRLSSTSGLRCPAANAQTYTDPAGIQYMIGCGADTTNGNYAVSSIEATGSFNDCFTLCSSNYQSSTNCTAFTWVGDSATGAGPGTCFFKNTSPESFTSADSQHIGVIRVQYYVPGTYIPGASSATTTTTTASSAVSSSSLTSSTRSSSSSSSAMQTTSGSSTFSGSSTAQIGSTSAGQVTPATPSLTSVSSSTQSSSAGATSPSASCVPGSVTDTNSKSYTIQCNSDTSSGSTGTQQFNSGDYMQCMPACDATSGCSGWTWTPYELGGGICYFKSGQLTFTAGLPGYVGGTLAGSSSASTTSPSTSSQTGGQSTVSSATTASSSSGSQSTAIASCPGSNGQTVTDVAGVQYQIACSSDTSGGNYNVYSAPSGLSDCFAFCDSSQFMDSTQCTAWTYAGSVNGAGPGQCFVKNGAGTAFVAADNTHVGAIRVSSSSTVTSSPSSISSSSVEGSTTSMSTTAAQGSTISMSSSGSSPSPSAVACQNNTQITDINGKTYSIYCDADTSGSGGGGFAQQPFDHGEFTQCNAACDATANCGAWVWVPYTGSGGGVCYLKQLPQSYIAGTASYVAGILVSGQSTTTNSSLAVPSSAATPSGSFLSGSSGASTMTMPMQSTTSSPSSSPTPYGPQCPAANGTTYIDPTNVQYMVLCDTDTTPGAAGTSAESNFGSCIDACSQQAAPSCVAVTYAGGTCYFKSQYQNSASSQGVEAAVLLSILIGGSGTSSPGQSSQTSITMSSSAMSNGNPASSTQSDSTSSTAAAMPTSSTAVGMSTSSPSAGMATSSPASSGGMTTQSTSGMSSTNSQPGSMISSTESMYQSTSLRPATTGTATAPPCPTSTYDLCNAPSAPTMCSSSSGNTYDTSCGVEYEGTVIDTSGITSINKRATLPTFQDCQYLCDHTTGCVALNYEGTNCTLLSSVTGTKSVPGAVGANIVSVAPNPSGTSSMGTMESMSMSSSMGMSKTAESPTTGTMVMSTSSGLATTGVASSTSSLSACPTQSTGPQPSGDSSCADAYGNPFNVTYGKAYTGTITVRAVKPNLDSCLTLCDTTPGCQAVNYIGGECQILTQVTGTTTAAGADAGATRPPDVSTVYTAPPTSTSSLVAATSTPASNGATPTMSGGGGGVSTGMQMSNGGMPGSSAGQSSPGMTGGSTPASPSTTPGLPSSGNGLGVSTMSNQPSETVIGGTTYISTNGDAPTTQVTMANPSNTPSSGMSGGPSGGGGGPGPVSGGNSGIISGATSSPSVASSQGASSSINTNKNQATASATTSSSNPASTGPVCPNYDDQHYTDQQGTTYNVRCNITFTGSVISSTNSTSNKHKRVPVAWTVHSCMHSCDQNAACKAIVFDCSDTCTLLASIDPLGPPSYFCGFSARKLKGTSGGSGGNNVVTVTVCAAKRTRTTTVLTTATLKTCPANAHCTAGGGRWLANGMVDGEED